VYFLLLTLNPTILMMLKVSLSVLAWFSHLTSLGREDCNGSRSRLAGLDEWQGSFDRMDVTRQISI
jgi:hypothetical protein